MEKQNSCYLEVGNMICKWHVEQIHRAAGRKYLAFLLASRHRRPTAAELKQNVYIPIHTYYILPEFMLV